MGSLITTLVSARQRVSKTEDSKDLGLNLQTSKAKRTLRVTINKFLKLEKRRPLILLLIPAH